MEELAVSSEGKEVVGEERSSASGEGVTVQASGQRLSAKEGNENAPRRSEIAISGEEGAVEAPPLSDDDEEADEAEAAVPFVEAFFPPPGAVSSFFLGKKAALISPMPTKNSSAASQAGVS